MIKLIDIIKNIEQDIEYQQLSNHTEQNLFESYTFLGEILNPNDSYQYKLLNKYLWQYTDSNQNDFYVRLIHQPTSPDYFEIKTFWLGDNNTPIYDYLPQNVSTKDWHKRGNTVAKIYRDEIIPFFNKQNMTNVLKIKPMDIKRYQFSIRMVNKFTPKTLNIIENKPKDITIRK